MQADVIVVGAGPAGLIAAGRAASLGARVLVLEKMERAGRKLLITGKGRCNITNDAPVSDFLDHIYPNARFLKFAFSTFFSKDIVELLGRHGLETVVERGGRVFPVTDRAADVLEAILKWLRTLPVEIRFNQKVERLLIRDGVVTGVAVSSGSQTREMEAKSVILCTGGASYPATGSTGDGYRMAAAVGHAVEPAKPALVPLETAGNRAQRLQGLSLRNCNASVWVNGRKTRSEFGEMLFTHFGLSGPIILSLSRFVVDELHKKSKVEISVDLKPALDEVKLDQRLIRDLNENGRKKMVNIFRQWLPALLIPLFLDETGIDGEKEGHQVTSKERRKAMLLMKDLRFTVTGHRSFKEAIITAGGVLTAGIESKTMASKTVKNLYFAGEVIDLDADTGGYNLQIAWSTAWLAGTACIAAVSPPSP